MTAVNDVGANFATCSKLTEEACAKGARIIFFPECFSSVSYTHLTLPTILLV